jgi:hypothetical protein
MAVLARREETLVIFIISEENMLEEALSLKQVADRLGVPYYKVQYAIACGQVAEPKTRLANRRVFTPADLKRLAKHFRRELPRADAAAAEPETAAT